MQNSVSREHGITDYESNKINAWKIITVYRKQPLGFVIKVTTPSYIRIFSNSQPFAFRLIQSTSVRISSLIIPVCRIHFGRL